MTYVVDMIRVILAIVWTVILAVWTCILAVLGLGTVLCLFYGIYELLRHGGLPDISLATLFLEVYEYLLPPQFVVLNTIFIYCAKLPLVVLFGALFCLALLLDRLCRGLFRWAGTAF